MNRDFDLGFPDSEALPPPAYEPSQADFDRKTALIGQSSAPVLDDEGFEIWSDDMFERALAARAVGTGVGASAGTSKDKSPWMQTTATAGGPSHNPYAAGPSSPPPAQPRTRPTLPIPQAQPQSNNQFSNQSNAQRLRGDSLSSSQTNSPVDEFSSNGRYANPPPAFQEIAPVVSSTPVAVGRPASASPASYRPPSAGGAHNSAVYAPSNQPAYGATTSASQGAVFNQARPPSQPSQFQPAHRLTLPPASRPNGEGPAERRATSWIGSSPNPPPPPRAPVVPFNPMAAYGGGSSERSRGAGFGGPLAVDNSAAPSLYKTAVSSLMENSLSPSAPGQSQSAPNTASFNLPQQFKHAYNPPFPQSNPAPSSNSVWQPPMNNSAPAPNQQYGFNNTPVPQQYNPPANTASYPNNNGGYGGVYNNGGYSNGYSNYAPTASQTPTPANPYAQYFSQQQPYQPQQPPQQAFYPTPAAVGAVGASNGPWGGMPPGAQAPQNVYDRRF